MKKRNKKALMAVMAFTLGASAPLCAKASQDGVFNLKELNSGSILIAQEGKCAGGKCGGNMKGKEGKCGPKKMMKKVFKKDKGTEATTKAKSKEAKCGEGKCGADKEKKN